MIKIAILITPIYFRTKIVYALWLTPYLNQNYFPFMIKLNTTLTFTANICIPITFLLLITRCTYQTFWGSSGQMMLVLKVVRYASLMKQIQKENCGQQRPLLKFLLNYSPLGFSLPSPSWKDKYLWSGTFYSSLL